MLFLLCLDAPAQPPTVTIQADRPGRAISPHLLGIFFEDLNYAADGGLYAELIQNRSFEYSATDRPEWGPLSFWDTIRRGGGAGSVRLQSVRPIHANNPHYAILTVDRPGDGVGLQNSGFDGIPLEEGETYEASFWAYQTFMNDMWGADNGIEGRPMPIALRLETPAGELLAEAKLDVAGRGWKRYSARMTSHATNPDARLLLLAQAKGGVALDMVSLFPERTFYNRPNGLREDLARTIAAIKPKFMRFPGGCLVHGPGIHRYYDWKESVGPVERRKARSNIWGYHQTLGLGYFEYFQFCEDIGAMPLPVVSAGVCCQHAGDSPHHGQEGLPLQEMPSYIQDILDLIEWANGPASSKWGAQRTAAGHPKPFGLKFLGLGNEDAITPLFRERFALIHKVLKAKHPEIVVIGTSGPFASGEDYDNGWSFANKLKVAMVDEHYYLPPQWFWDSLDRYNSYSRTGPKVYVGEYAAHDREKSRNTLRTALAEAAALTAFERNGDVVQFASYAPLLARVRHTQWTPDLIYFTGTEVFPSANYHVQKIFGQNSGDRYLDPELRSLPKTMAVSAVRDSASRDIIVKIVNGGTTQAPLNLDFRGLTPNIRFDVLSTILSGPGPDAMNEPGTPPSITPVKKHLRAIASFDWEAPANSLSVLRISRPPSSRLPSTGTTR